MTTEYDDWMDSLTQKERNEQLKYLRSQERVKKQTPARTAASWCVRMTGYAIMYLGKGLVWVGEKLQSLSYRL